MNVQPQSVIFRVLVKKDSERVVILFGSSKFCTIQYTFSPGFRPYQSGDNLIIVINDHNINYSSLSSTPPNNKPNLIVDIQSQYPDVPHYHQ